MSTITARSQTRIKRVLLCLFAAGIGGTVLYDVSTFATAPLLLSAAFGVFLTAFLLATAAGFVPWAHERVSDLAAALLWGGGFAILIAIAAERAVANYLLGQGIPVTVSLNVITIAPVVEELVKAAGLIGLLLLARGRANPFILALAIGIGFGTIENIQYFTQGLTQYGLGQDYFELLLGRGLVGPLLHASCVGFTGLGLLLTRGRPTFLRIPVVAVTLTLGMLMHSLCNGAFGIVQSNYVESGIVVAASVLLVYLAKRSRVLTPAVVEVP